MLLAIVPALLVIPQPDLGTGMVYVAVGFSDPVLRRHVVEAADRAGGDVRSRRSRSSWPGAPALGVHVLKPYQVQRLTGFLDPSSDAADSQTYTSYTESLIAIGSGQKTGRGNDATQTKLNFLPANDTDFVFAAVGETYGFVGAAVVLSLYALLIWRALRILTMSKNLFGTLIAAGILAMLMFQIFVNVGMTIGIMPITGVPCRW